MCGAIGQRCRGSRAAARGSDSGRQLVVETARIAGREWHATAQSRPRERGRKWCAECSRGVEAVERRVEVEDLLRPGRDNGASFRAAAFRHACDPASAGLSLMWPVVPAMLPPRRGATPTRVSESSPQSLVDAAGPRPAAWASRRGIYRISDHRRRNAAVADRGDRSVACQAAAVAGRGVTENAEDRVPRPVLDFLAPRDPVRRGNDAKPIGRASAEVIATVVGPSRGPETWARVFETAYRGAPLQGITRHGRPRARAATFVAADVGVFWDELADKDHPGYVPGVPRVPVRVPRRGSTACAARAQRDAAARLRACVVEAAPWNALLRSRSQRSGDTLDDNAGTAAAPSRRRGLPLEWMTTRAGKVRDDDGSGAFSKVGPDGKTVGGATPHCEWHDDGAEEDCNGDERHGHPVGFKITVPSLHPARHGRRDGAMRRRRRGGTGSSDGGTPSGTSARPIARSAGATRTPSPPRREKKRAKRRHAPRERKKSTQRSQSPAPPRPTGSSSSSSSSSSTSVSPTPASSSSDDPWIDALARAAVGSAAPHGDGHPTIVVTPDVCTAHAAAGALAARVGAAVAVAVWRGEKKRKRSGGGGEGEVPRGRGRAHGGAHKGAHGGLAAMERALGEIEAQVGPSRSGFLVIDAGHWPEVEAIADPSRCVAAGPRWWIGGDDRKKQKHEPRDDEDDDGAHDVDAHVGLGMDDDQKDAMAGTGEGPEAGRQSLPSSSPRSPPPPSPSPSPSPSPLLSSLSSSRASTLVAPAPLPRLVIVNEHTVSRKEDPLRAAFGGGDGSLASLAELLEGQAASGEWRVAERAAPAHAPFDLEFGPQTCCVLATPEHARLPAGDPARTADRIIMLTAIYTTVHIVAVLADTSAPGAPGPADAACDWRVAVEASIATLPSGRARAAARVSYCVARAHDLAEHLREIATGARRIAPAAGWVEEESRHECQLSAVVPALHPSAAAHCLGTAALAEIVAGGGALLEDVAGAAPDIARRWERIVRAPL